MTEQHSSEPIGKEQFLYPQHPYHGKFTPEGLVFNANLQEFGQKIVYLCGLETNGKITSREAYTGHLEKSKDLIKNRVAEDKKALS